MISCSTRITVDEFCVIKSRIPGEYIIRGVVLPLIENNDTTNMVLDTMYLKIDKKTNYKFRLKNRAEYEESIGEVDFDVEQYIYLASSNYNEEALNPTSINYNIPKYTDWIKCICTKDMNAKLLKTVAKKLNEKGYHINPIANLKFEDELKNVLIKYQKDNKLPLASLNLMTLKSLGIRVMEK